MKHRDKLQATRYCMTRKFSLSVALSTLSLLSLAVFPALADETSTSSTVTTTVTTTSTIPAVTVPAEIESGNKINPSGEGSTNDLDQVTNLDTLKKKGAMQIKIRLDALAKLSRRVAASHSGSAFSSEAQARREDSSGSRTTKLTAEQKTQLQAEITTNTNGLTELGVKIASSTDLEAARVLVKSIYTDFRIFAVFIPRVNGLMHVWLSLANIERVALSLALTETKIVALKAKGVDTSKMETAVAEIRTSLGTAKTKFDATAATLATIKPADYPGSGETFKRLRTIIRDAEKQVNRSRQAIHRLNALIRLSNQAEVRKLKLLERRAKEEAHKKEERDEFKQERKDEREEVKNKIKELRENLKEKVKDLKNTTSTAK